MVLILHPHHKEHSANIPAEAAHDPTFEGKMNKKQQKMNKKQQKRARKAEAKAERVAAKKARKLARRAAWANASAFAADAVIDDIAASEAPGEDSAPAEILAPAGPQGGWTEYADGDSGRSYYVHGETRVTQWDKPVGHPQPHPQPHQPLSLHTGDHIDVQDHFICRLDRRTVRWQWRHAIVQRVSPDGSRIEVRFDGWHDRYNIVLNLDTQHRDGWCHATDDTTDSATDLQPTLRQWPRSPVIVRGPRIAEFGSKILLPRAACTGRVPPLENKVVGSPPSPPPSPRSVPLPPPPSKLSVCRALALRPLARRPPSPPLSPLSEPLPPSPLESCIDATPFVPTAIPTATPPLPPPLPPLFPLPHTRPATTPPGFKATDRQRRECGGDVGARGARGGGSLVKGLDLSTGCLLAQVLRASGAFSQLL